MAENRTTYDKLITPDGQPQYGRFPQTFSEINFQDFDFRNPMDGPVNRLQKHFGFNQFHFIGLHSQHYTVACAVANVRYVASAFVYLFNHETGQIHPFSFVQPLGFRCHQSKHPFSGASRFSKGSARFEILSLQQPNRYQLNIEIGRHIQISAELSELEGYQPLVLCSKAGYNGWTFTQKHTALDVSGHITWEGKKISLEDHQFVASSDWSCGYMRRETAWNWTSISSILADGTRLGLNLACGVNETSFNENTLWLNGTAQALPPCLFEFNRKQRLEPWKIRTTDNTVNLTFVPEGSHREKINAILVASNFTQLPGKYFGTIKSNSGRIIQLEGINGLAEDHYAKW